MPTTELTRPEDFIEYADGYAPERTIGFETEMDAEDYRDKSWLEQLPKPVDFLQLSIDDRRLYDQLSLIPNELLFNILEHRKFDMDPVVYSELYKHYWLRNGGKVYPDMNHFEVCSPEDLGPRRAVASQRATNLLLRELITGPGLPSRFELPDGIHVYRRSGTVSHTGKISTKGYHMNLLMPESVQATMDFGGIDTHLATMLYAWGGMFTQDGFELSQKASGIGSGTKIYDTEATIGTDTKPLASLRYKQRGKGPFGEDADDTSYGEFGFARYEIRSATPSNPWGEFMAAATTSVLLRALENRRLQPEYEELCKLKLADPAATIKDVSADITMQTSHRLANGRDLDVISIQERLCTIAEHIATKLHLPEDEQFAVTEWRHILTDLRAVQRREQRLINVMRRVGYAARLLVINAALEREDKLDDPMARLAACYHWDLQFPDKDGRRGTSSQIEDKFADNNPYTPELLQSRIHSPPPDTRAKLRGQAVIDQRRPGSGARVKDWSTIATGQPGSEVPHTLHPYQTQL